MADREFIIKASVPQQSAFMVKRGRVLVIGDVDQGYVARALAAYEGERGKRRIKVMDLERAE